MFVSDGAVEIPKQKPNKTQLYGNIFWGVD
jgi:hypothetical protein